MESGYAVTVIRIRVGLVRDQITKAIAADQPEGDSMQLCDDQQVNYNVVALDAKGYAVQGQTFSATSSDNAVVTVTKIGDGIASTFVAVAGHLGTATLTFTTGNVSATEVVTVVPSGRVASIRLLPGEPYTQP